MLILREPGFMTDLVTHGSQFLLFGLRNVSANWQESGGTTVGCSILGF